MIVADALADLSFRALFDATVDALLLIDEEGRIILANLPAQQLFGYSENELRGKMVEMLMPARYRARHRHYRRLFADRPEKRAMGEDRELTILKRNGAEHTLDIGLTPIEIQQRLYSLITLNVAAWRLQAKQAMQASEERLGLAKQIAGLGVFDWDCCSATIYWDEQMRKLWGREGDEIVTYEEFVAAIHPADRVAHQSVIDRAAMDPAGEGLFKADYRVIGNTHGIERWIAAIGQVHFEAGKASRMIGVVREITEKRKLRKKLQARRAEREDLFKRQVAARTASAIAHEINQPLTAISAYSEIVLHALQQREFDKDQLKKALEGCVEQAQRAGHSLHQLLAFLQRDEAITERLNLGEVIEEALAIMREEGIEAFHSVLQLEQNLPAVQSNRIHIQKVLVNLFRNAVEAMQAANVVDMTVTISGTIWMETGMVLVTVKDNGPGLDPSSVKRLFEPFFTTKPAAGIGLGLSICRALIENNGGHFWVCAKVSSGTEFHFTLPSVL